MAKDFSAARAAYQRRDRSALLKSMGPEKADEPDREEKVDNLLRWPEVDIPDSSLSDCFVESMRDAAQRLRQPDMPPPQQMRSPVEWDFISDLSGFDLWSDDQLLNRLALDSLPARKKLAMVGTLRNDGIYVLEWLAHYRMLGFQHFFLYTNDNGDRSDDLLKCLAKAGVVTVIQNDISGEVPPETKAFGHALNLVAALRDYEWAAFVDSDEFLVPAPRYNYSMLKLLEDLDRHYPPGRIAGLCLDWLWFTSNRVFHRAPGLLCERFQQARPHKLSKCVVRVRDVLSMRMQHYPDVVPGCYVVDGNFKLFKEADMLTRSQPAYGAGQMNHYWPKSFEEFAVKKARAAILGGDNNPYNRDFELFFTWNGDETTDTSHPTAPIMIHRIREQMEQLRLLPGVAAAADSVDQGFPAFLSGLWGGSERLLDIYYKFWTNPGPL